MNKWKTSFLVCLALLVVSNLFWLYAVIDQSVSYSYLSDSFDNASDSRRSLGMLIVDGAKKCELSQKDVLFLLRQADPNAFIVEESNTITTSFAKFNFTDDRLVYVE